MVKIIAVRLVKILFLLENCVKVGVLRLRFRFLDFLYEGKVLLGDCVEF